ncbi:cytochrome c oxidase assembly factor CtaG [Bacillus sp. FJAT-27225]|uniref:cytochrome c oxidase assembly factor CtaG n=1 Tax=Bacillus sp. FJAT-27225 TaxID=1743144 RepID=UPI00080C3471|nr:cytochrome c oxidase assembly factor CtaG [Bacillus sp. FJAT-27225]OCA85573.1 cytochrome c oxidase assembly factor CtaG [Bacillus sp. FJAT-27225]
MLSLKIFGTQALWSPYFLLSILAVIAVYFLITVKYREKIKGSEPLRARQAGFFLTAMVLLYAIKGSPLDLLGHITFYAHMIQMATLYLVVPPLFILGIPEWLWRAVISLPIIRNVFPILVKPLIAIIVFNGMFSFYHIPLIFDAVKLSIWMHAGITSLIFLFATFMWWPIVTELKEYQTLSGLRKIGYIFANGILITPACALIIFSNEPLYATFSDPRAWAKALELCVSPTMLAGLDLSGPQMFSSMTLEEDQRLGGVIMKIIQEIVYSFALARVFFKWYKDEHTGIDPEPEPFPAE